MLLLLPPPSVPSNSFLFLPLPLWLWATLHVYIHTDLMIKLIPHRWCWSSLHLTDFKALRTIFMCGSLCCRKWKSCTKKNIRGEKKSQHIRQALHTHKNRKTEPLLNYGTGIYSTRATINQKRFIYVLYICWVLDFFSIVDETSIVSWLHRTQIAQIQTPVFCVCIFCVWILIHLFLVLNFYCYCPFFFFYLVSNPFSLFVRWSFC